MCLGGGGGDVREEERYSFPSKYPSLNTYRDLHHCFSKVACDKSFILCSFLDQNPETLSELFHSLDVWHKSCKLTAKLSSVRL